jgi:hypothetical protein
MPPIRDGLYYSTIQCSTEYSTEYSQRCKVYAESKIRSGKMDKKNARLARSRAFSLENRV